MSAWCMVAVSHCAFSCIILVKRQSENELHVVKGFHQVKIFSIKKLAATVLQLFQAA
jgi:hypothetical protein